MEELVKNLVKGINAYALKDLMDTLAKVGTSYPTLISN